MVTIGTGVSAEQFKPTLFAWEFRPGSEDSPTVIAPTLTAADLALQGTRIFDVVLVATGQHGVERFSFPSLRSIASPEPTVVI
jgi:hypothetical protein